jgi:hypothetical protein
MLGHALYMKAIHGGKTKNDRIDSRKSAGLLRSHTRSIGSASLNSSLIPRSSAASS